jgi:hypothetical protein
LYVTDRLYNVMLMEKTTDLLYVTDKLYNVGERGLIFGE